MIPQVVDTVVYIEAGEVHTVYDVTTEVKVPHGLMEEDLTRPVVVIRDFETGEASYEIYTFNNQVVTVPLDEEGDDETGVDRIAKGEIEREVESVARDRVGVEITGRSSARVYVSEDDISTVIGKGGGRISDIEDRLGMEIDVRTHDERPDGARHAGGGGGSGGSGGGCGSGEIVSPEVTSRHVMVPAEGYHGETVEVRAGDEYLFTATVSRGGEIQVSRGSAIAEELERAIDRGQRVTIAPQ
jgi:ATPase